MSDPDQCALGPDGKLLDAKDITFFNDPDDMVPLPPASSTSTATTITDFFGTAAPPRRSTRAPVPSTRTTDPNNSETTKRKPATALPHPRASARRRSGVESEDADAAQDTEPEDDVDMADATASNSSQHNDSGDDDGEEDPMTEYLKTKAFGEADLEGMQRRKKASATDDVKLMYTADTVDDPHTGKSMTGHWCKLCKIAKRSFKEAFFTGSVSSQRAHIRRNIDHYEVYHRLCEKNKIPEHHAAIPDDTKGIEKQGTLDGFATQTPRIPAFTREGLLDYICELIVTEDGAFRLVDKKPFRVLLQYCRPSLADKDIPHRTMVRDEIEDRARLVIHRVREKLKLIPGLISFTFDTWTSKIGAPYLGVTGHYIDAPKENPTAWVLKSEQLAYTPLHGNHSGANMSKILLHTLDRYEIRDKVGWFTADNATNNDTALVALAEDLNADKDFDTPDWDPVEHRVRCMEHAVHLGAGHFISDVSPMSAKAVLAKVKRMRLKLQAENPDLDLDELDALAQDGGSGDEEDDEGEEDPEEEKIAAGDAVGKGLALINQIRKSPQAQAYFAKTCKGLDVPVLQLLGWIRTRWASLYAFLDRILLLQKAVNQFAVTADECDEVPDLQGKSYADFKLNKIDWVKIRKMHEVLQEPAKIQQSFSSARFPTVWRTLPLLEFLQQSWRNMAATEKFADMKDSIGRGLENLEKWYRKTDDSDVYFICLALDPNYKTEYAQHQWGDDAFIDGMVKFKTKFDLYYKPPVKEADNPDAAPSEGVVQYGHEWMRAAVKTRRAADFAKVDPREELKAYLAAPLETTDDVVGWWGHHAEQYPTLARMARDYLAIQGSATASERAFSNGSLTATLRRNRLTPEMFEALQILKSAYRNGHIEASEEARKRMVDFLDAFDGELDDVDTAA